MLLAPSLLTALPLLTPAWLTPVRLAPVFQSSKPDLIVLDDGKEIECRVLFEDENTIVYTKKRKAIELAREDVKSVQSIERSLRTFLDAYDELPDNDPAALSDLASFCEGRELLGEARSLWIRILTVDPTNEMAWTKLGGVHSKRRGWRLKVRGRFYSIEDLRERVSDWKNALELPTAHFLLKTDVPPERALDLSIDVERAYLTFYDLLGNALRLYPFDEVPELHIFADAKDYPSPPTPGQVAWFSLAANTLYVNATAAESLPHTAVSELTDVLLFNAFRRTVGKTGTVAPWARNGIAQAFGGAFRRDPGHASWDLSIPIHAHFDTHAAAGDELSLEDVLRAGWASFDSGSNAHIFAAKCYTLVHFLAFANAGERRAELGEFLVSSFRGQGAATHLEKILGVKLDELESRWNEYVRVMARR